MPNGPRVTKTHLGLLPTRIQTTKAPILGLAYRYTADSTFLLYPSSKSMKKFGWKRNLKWRHEFASGCYYQDANGFIWFYLMKLEYFSKLENLEIDGNSNDHEIPDGHSFVVLPRDHILSPWFLQGQYGGFCWRKLIICIHVCTSYTGVLTPWEMILTNCAFRRHWCMRIQHDLGPRHQLSILWPI